MEVCTPRALGALIRACRRELNFGQDGLLPQISPGMK